jgi:hypothetical protein
MSRTGLVARGSRKFKGDHDIKKIGVLTFHRTVNYGVAFSINFNKNFFMGLLPAPANVNSRLEDIIRLFNLEERQIKEDMKIDFFKDIDYKRVNDILSRECNKSIAYLNSILGQSYESD